MTKAAAPALSLKDVEFAWRRREQPVIALPSLKVAAGETVFLRGPSGSGKSTLLGLIAGIETPQAGSVDILGTRIDKLPAAARDRFRAEHLGIIFQLFNLLPYLSLVENVTLPCRFSPDRAKAATAAHGSVKAAGIALLERLGLGELARSNRSVAALSVGQQQRVAAARALIGAPGLIVADEPTSALDTDNRDAFLATLLEEARRSGAAVLFVSHDEGLGSRFDRQLDLPAINRARQTA